MAKAKPKAAIMVADGAGGMVQVQDRRFEMGDWPIRFEVPKEQADTWLRYLYAECERRRWSSGGIGQLEARENSGSITVNIGGAAKPQLAVVWERKRGGPIKVRARSAGVPEFPLVEAEEFFSQVNDRCRSGVTEPVYRRGQLQFDGLAWRGEFWLDDTVRLGPPTEQYEAAAGLFDDCARRLHADGGCFNGRDSELRRRSGRSEESGGGLPGRVDLLSGRLSLHESRGVRHCGVDSQRDSQ